MAWRCYGLSVLVIVAGALLASGSYPGGFDWAYQVMSALASRKHNPEGGAWFAGGLALGMALLLPLAYRLFKDVPKGARGESWGARLVLFGIVCGIGVGVERLLFHHLSDLIGKAHEALALLAFLSLFPGLLLMALTRGRRSARGRWGALVVVLPLVAIGLSQLGVYLDQRDLGWVGRDWRELGVPLWYSFAFWQWLAAASIWISLGWLLACGPDSGIRNRGD